MNRKGTFSTVPPTEGKRVENTKQLTPGAREQFATGKNEVGKRFKTNSKGKFGTLGARGFAGD